jgi:hypothetical protein
MTIIIIIIITIIIIINFILRRQKLAASCVAVVLVCSDVGTRHRHVLRFLKTGKRLPAMAWELEALLLSSL